MSDGTKIEWTDATWTPIRARRIYVNAGDPGWRPALPGGKAGWHCEHVSEGCRNCYAEAINKRLGTGLEFKPGHRANIEVFLDEKTLFAPLKWKKPRHIFVCSMTDAFADFVQDEWLDRIFAVMALSPQHTFQVLTKRAERMRTYCTAPDVRFRAEKIARDMTNDSMSATVRRYFLGNNAPIPHVWLGISAEDQTRADERIPLLLQTPAAVRFVSLEPLLGPISFRWAKWDNWKDAEGYARNPVDHLDGLRILDWVIVGGESGPNARPMHPDWARSLRDQCAEAGVPFFFKQWGTFAPGALNDKWETVANDGNLKIDDPKFDIAQVTRVGKKAAGRLLDGIEHNGMPP